jgi:alkanesulfonate monooxygenase SsuD/methylene tetrahydromethanopterin reductase-like flavin-dependent oxidoreductase (luciferase family)
MPVLLAATAPRMMDLAADAADGIALGVLQSVEFVADIADRCRQRSPLGDNFSVYTAAMVSAHADGDVARRDARQAIVDLFAVKPHPHYERLLRLQGYAEFADRLMRRITSTGAAGAEAEVPDEVVDALTIAGTPTECADQIAKFGRAVDALLVVNVATMQQVTPEGRGSIPAREQLVASYNSLFELASKVREGASHVG